MRVNKLLFFIVLIPLFFISFYNAVPAEKLSIIVGIGNDLNPENSKKYSATFEILSDRSNSHLSSIPLTGSDLTLYTSENERQMENSKKWLWAEVIYILSEDRARLGIEDLVDSFIRDTSRNERAYIIVSKQDSKTVFSIPTPPSYSVSEHINGIIKNLNESNFYSNRYEVIDLMLMESQNGRNIVLPYIEIEDNKPKVNGLALFEGNQMIKYVPLDEAKLINLLRNKNGEGFLSILSDNPQQYIDLKGKSSSKVKVSLEEDKLKYDIFINMKGYILVNSLKNSYGYFDDTRVIEKTLEDKVKNMLLDEINLIQNNYRFDCLDLTRYAIAKFGDTSPYISKENFLNSKIDVHVNVKILSGGKSIDPDSGTKLFKK
ncbi:Ger(x)C family spore germination C-terminal domain-containing protein [Clostridium amazonitimonense]|uniref:Ger(x)C family spore germination C-terminal domain-containing protein n=1 Tax=Clostridium amazonitimonense TaxID=1499689 RepID=UPI00050950C5|nr:Ger(x)C family spore germination C-terminal domain-containing protein [Clostridium amazonitimonense]